MNDGSDAAAGALKNAAQKLRYGKQYTEAQATAMQVLAMGTELVEHHAEALRELSMAIKGAGSTVESFVPWRAPAQSTILNLLANGSNSSATGRRVFRKYIGEILLPSGIITLSDLEEL